MLELDQWENLTLEEFYHPEYQYYLRIFMDIVFFISTGVYGFTIFVVLMKSTKSMGTFKYNALAQLTCNFFLELLLFIYCPVLHWPMTILSYYSHFSISLYYPFLQVSLFYFAVVSAVITFLLTLLFRVLAVFDVRLSILLPKINIYVISGSVAFVMVVFLSINIPIFYMERDPNELHQKLEGIVPAFVRLHRILPHTFGIVSGYNDDHTLQLICTIVFWLSTAILIFLALNFIFLIRLRKIQKQISKQTLILHAMLYRAITVQVCVTVTLTMLPASAMVILLMIQWKNSSWLANLCLPIVSLHFICDAASLLFFVKPYRTYVHKIFESHDEVKVVKKMPSPNSTLHR